MIEKKPSLPTSSVHTLTHGIFQYTWHGHKPVKIGTDMYKDLDGHTLIKFSISGQWNRTRMVTPTIMQYYDSPFQLLLTIQNMLIESFTKNGNLFGLAVTRTSKYLGLEDAPQSYTLSNTYQKELR